MKPEEARQQLNRIQSEFGIDRMTVITSLMDLLKRCKDGIPQEKLSAKDGVVEVLERYPEAERKILDDIAKHITQLEAIANSDKKDDKIEFILNIEKLEDEL